MQPARSASALARTARLTGRLHVDVPSALQWGPAVMGQLKPLLNGRLVSRAGRERDRSHER